MSELNPSQQRIADTHEGMIVVDAGPGTGKTHTIVERYISMISRQDISPKDVLLLTFTNNAAAEMEERIKRRMTEKGMERDSKLVMTKTFDAFCLSIVMDSPDEISEFFGFKEKLTRSAYMQENDSLNRDYFHRFFDGFLSSKGSDYGDIAVIASENPESLMDLIENLMSRGLIPLSKGWFGNHADRILEGDTEQILELLRANNSVTARGKCLNVNALSKIDDDQGYNVPGRNDGGNIDGSFLEESASENRTELYRFVHDVYYDYIKQSITDNRLTFHLVAILAFTVLYRQRNVRERNSFRYLMVDEFQDTNANQLMISLMILKEPNLCVVGDWKQGIYGFRYVSIENITRFEEKTVEYRRFLNIGDKRVGFSIPEAVKLPLDVNYRSSQEIIDTAFECICLPGSNDDVIG
ncbi:UvrD-helicase domain-containing protein [Methanomassiliicoccales archaeon LGM-RCC1]|nr:UvrD-helicase domain-containing protein [Methanomassiliicoccales archaeon LGM-RCC1]